MRKLVWLLPILLWTSITQAWVVEDFSVMADIQSDGTVNIQETITGNFSDNRSKHGIFRIIPYRYKDEEGRPFKTPITNISVTDQNGKARTFVKTTPNSNLKLKIGDADKYVNQIETYVIKYRISGVINAFDEHDEFYWNVTGNEWDAPIKQASITVSMPEARAKVQAECFTGPKNSNRQDCAFNHTNDNTATEFKTISKYKFSEEAEAWTTQVLRFCDPKTTANNPNCQKIHESLKKQNALEQRPHLNWSEGFTIVSGWDKGLVAIPERIYEFDPTPWAEKIQFLFLLFPAWIFYKLMALRRKVADHSPIIPRYHPPKDLTLGQTLHLYRGKTSPKDLTAIITQLGALGALTIKEQEAKGLLGKNTYLLTPLGSAGKNLSEEAQYAYDHLFFKSPDKPITLRQIAKSKQAIFAYKRYEDLKKIINKDLGKYFLNPNFDLKIFLFGLLGMFVVVPILVAVSGLTKSPFAAITMGAALLLLFFFPRRNQLGNQKLNEIKGYVEFLQTAEKQKINWSEAQNIFEKNLPYAVAFGLTEKWAKVFKDKVQVPDWYQNQDGNTSFNRLDRGISRVSGSAIASASAAHHRSVAASRRSSGFSGGSSGGGFGGGGGGSW